MAQGSYQEIQTSGYDIANLIGELEKTTIDSDTEVFNQNNKMFDTKQNSSLNGSNDKNSSSLTERKLNDFKASPVAVAESRSFGRVSKNVFMSYFSAVGSTYYIVMFFSTFIITQVLITVVELWISIWYCIYIIF